MTEALFVAASIFIPLVFGFVPAFLPVGVPVVIRWLLWLAVTAAIGWYVHLLRDAPSPYPELALAILLVSAVLSLVVLVVETGRPPRLVAGRQFSGGAAPPGRSSPALPPAPRLAARRKR